LSRNRRETNLLDRALAHFEREEENLYTKLRGSASTRASLEKLMKAEMPRSELMRSLLFIAGVAGDPLTFDDLTGLPPRKLRQARRTLSLAALFIDQMTKARRQDLLEDCFPPLMLENATSAQERAQVSAYLRKAAARLGTMTDHLIGRPENEASIADLVAEVWERTGDPHDAELAPLLGARPRFSI